MKRKYLSLPLAMAALAFTACSSDDIAPNGNGSSNFADGGYMKVAINLPTDASANRAANDNFDDGLESEYSVKNATLILLQGDTEADAKVHSAYDLSFSPSGKVNEQITTTSRIVAKADNEIGDKLFALVVLNNNGIVKADGNKLMVNGEDWSNKSFGDLQNLTLTQSFTGDGLLMANAALATTPGGAQASEGEVKVLTDVSGQVYKTEAEAAANPAASIYVERAMAKVTMQPKEGTFDDKSENSELANLTYKLDGWALDVTNKSSFFLHNTTGMADWKGLASDLVNTNPYRFVGHTPLENGVSLYRTYWGIDPNYGRADVTADFNKLVWNDANFSVALGNNAPQYCYENTFDVANQRNDRTTQAVVRVKVNAEGGTFYIVNGDKTKLYTTENIEKLVNATAAAKYGTEVESWIDALSAEVGKSLEASWKMTFGDRDENGVRPIAGVEAVATEAGKTETVGTYTLTADQIAAVSAELKDITEYTDGYAYYPIRIKHFGDDLTPWNAGETPTPGAGNVYPEGEQQAARYLGRYGVLRNNWYDLSINSIKGLGSAVVPSYNGDPDDELYNYISVRINVLSWAKRSQSADL